ncbi:unnamed protein product, partial [marine sediment metagenome]
PNEDTLTYSAGNLPSGATFTSRTFRWTPDYNQAGAYELTFAVSDGELTDSEDITINVNNVPSYGQISGTVTDADNGGPISGAQVSDGTRSATTYSTGSYTISDVPQGSYTVTASASDYQSSSKTVTVEADEASTANFSLTPVPNQAPVLSPIGDKNIAEGLLLR